MLELNQLVFGHEQKALTKPFSAKVSKGEIIFLVGQNGSGKTTLLRTLAGVSKPLNGTVSICNGVVFLPSSVSAADTLTGLDIFEIYGGQANNSSLLERPFATLSSGEQKQILLDATFSHSAQTVLLDEPFNFLDWSHALELIHNIEQQQQKGRSFVIATHQLDWALRVQESTMWSILDSHENSSRMIISGTTKGVLTSEEFQRSFSVNVQVLKNPLDKTHLLALSKRHTEA